MTHKEKEELIKFYFTDATALKLLEDQIGFDGRVVVDWIGGRVIAYGSKGEKEWDLNQMLVSVGTLARIKRQPVLH